MDALMMASKKPASHRLTDRLPIRGAACRGAACRGTHRTLGAVIIFFSNISARAKPLNFQQLTI